MATNYARRSQAQSGLTYAWTINGGTITSGGQGASVTFSAGSTGVVGLSVIATDTAGHASSAGTATSTINAVPVITGFTADKSEITAGQGIVLRWTTTGATTLTIDHGVGDVGQATSKTITPTASTQYTLSATNPAGTTATATVAVAVDAVPVISSFTATPATISGGGTSTLSATFAGGSGAITPGNLAITSGGTVNVSPSANQTYTLTVTNGAGGTTTATASVALSSGFFTVGAAMVHPRWSHTATLLANGKVLIAGGLSSTDGVQSAVQQAELYDPATGSFQATGSLLHTRSGHTATLLDNGKVLIVGGASDNSTVAELYDPVTGLFTATGALTAPRIQASAVKLGNGKVLIEGSDARFGAATADLYDPVSGTFSSVAEVKMAGHGGTAVLLADGRVLVPETVYDFDVGGFNKAQSEVFNASGASVVPTGARTFDSYHYLAVRLGDGRVLVAGGHTDGYGYATTSVAEIFDPATNTYARENSMQSSYGSGGAVVLLQSGKALVVADVNELYDPTTHQFSLTGPLSVPAKNFTATVLGDGRVLVVGGLASDNTAIANAQIYH